jgi:hypothetical protein
MKHGGTDRTSAATTGTDQAHRQAIIDWGLAVAELPEQSAHGERMAASIHAPCPAIVHVAAPIITRAKRGRSGGRSRHALRLARNAQGARRRIKSGAGAVPIRTRRRRRGQYPT